MERRTLTRRGFLSWCALAATGTVAAACAPKPVERVVQQTVEVEKQVEVVVTATPEALKEPAQIRFAEGSWVGPEGIKFWTDDIIGRFELENPDIKVTFENAEAPDYSDKLYTQAVAGDAPDVMFIWGGFGYDLMEKGQFLQLDEVIDDEYLADFYPGKLVAHIYDGHRYGLPKYESSIALAYNKDILDEAGVEYPTEEWTWDDYLSAVRATTKRDSAGNITQWGTYVLHGYLHPWVWMNEGEWMEGDLFGTKALFTEPQAVEALKLHHDLIFGPEPTAPLIGSVPEMGWWNVFSTGKIAFMDSMSWVVTNYVRENGFKWDFAELPESRKGKRSSMTENDGYAIYRGTKEPEAAVRMLKFVTSPWAERQGALGIIGLQPSRKSVAADWDNSSMGARAGYNVAAFSRAMDVARLHPAFRDNAKIGELTNPIWDQIWVTGEVGLEEGLQQMAQRIDEYFAQQS